MTLTPEAARKCSIAFQRFGLGAKIGGVERIAGNPKSALLTELNAANVGKITFPGLPSYQDACFFGETSFEKAEQLRYREIKARVDKHLSADIGFVERLVLFWSNHFSMTVNKSEIIRATIGQWERDVIRKNVLGNFGDMLLGTLMHPAMISYLDNADSIGPHSAIGRRSGGGINENLAREVMELHTLGSGGGYTEEDVTNFAYILTGWSYVRGWEVDYRQNGGNARNRGRYIYRFDWHEPGNIRLLGRVFPQQGQGQAILALQMLARHPSTAEHIAFKLVRHFITDEPTPAMVEPLKQAFLTTGGNLKAVATALLNLDAAWTLPLTKFRTPYEVQIAQFRALKYRFTDPQYWAFSETLNALHHRPWEAPSPEGYPDESLHWLDPDSMTLRVDTAQLSSWVYGPRAPYRGAYIGERIFNASLSRESREAMLNVANDTEGMTMLFSIPEFHRR